MLYNFTGGAFVTPTPLIFDPAAGTWHLPEPADYGDLTPRWRTSYERAIAALALVRAQFVDMTPVPHHSRAA